MASLENLLRAGKWLSDEEATFTTRGRIPHSILVENPVDLDETVSLTSKCVALPFESVIVHGHTQRTMMTDHQLNVMTQAPYPDDMAALPNGIYIT